MICSSIPANAEHGPDTVMTWSWIADGWPHVQSSWMGEFRLTSPEHRPPLEELVRIVQGLRTGDKEALARVYDMYAGTVYQVGLRFLGEEADAEDLVQDVFLGLRNALRSYHERGTFEAWLRRVAVRTALMRLRRTKQSWKLLQGHWWRLQRPQQETVPAAKFDLQRAISQLSTPLRAVFVLKEIEGYTHAEIALALGITATASKVRLYRARAMLQRYLGAS